MLISLGQAQMEQPNVVYEQNHKRVIYLTAQIIYIPNQFYIMLWQCSSAKVPARGMLQIEFPDQDLSPWASRPSELVTPFLHMYDLVHSIRAAHHHIIQPFSVSARICLAQTV